jgi:hypothetical protein
VRDIIDSSGYLDLWDADYKEHPWRYDITLMEQMVQKEQVADYCRGTLKIEPRDDNRFTKTLRGFLRDHSLHPRATFAIMITLYKKLAEMHARRIDTATLWLERHGSTNG